ncbi:hypothetical protein SEPCBS57363_006402 [Sporothrix epigloea]|uniref:Gag protein n=1 Tax=Sporothrix epigloea TaxID=1892477 RepID=A0ABP0E615_9PEZI
MSDYYDTFSQIPHLDVEEELYEWWKAMRLAIYKRKSVAYLDVDDPTYIGWTTERARNVYCGEKPSARFSEPLPAGVYGRQAPSANLTRASSGNLKAVAVQEAEAKRRFESWLDRLAYWEDSILRYETRRERFASELMEVDKLIESSVADVYKHFFAENDGPKEKIMTILERVRPSVARLALYLDNKYETVMDAAPMTIEPFHDPTFDAWLSKWRSMIRDQIDQDGIKVRQTRWLYDFGAIQHCLPTLAVRMHDLYKECLMINCELTKYNLVMGVVRLVDDSRRFEDMRHEHNQRKDAEAKQPTPNAPPLAPRGPKRTRHGNHKSGQAQNPQSSCCEGCDMPGHKLEHCWHLLPQKRPSRFQNNEKSREIQARATQRLAENPALAERLAKVTGPPAGGR